MNNQDRMEYSRFLLVIIISGLVVVLSDYSILWAERSVEKISISTIILPKKHSRACLLSIEVDSPWDNRMLESHGVRTDICENIKRDDIVEIIKTPILNRWLAIDNGQHTFYLPETKTLIQDFLYLSVILWYLYFLTRKKTEEFLGRPILVQSVLALISLAYLNHLLSIFT